MDSSVIKEHETPNAEKKDQLDQLLFKYRQIVESIQQNRCILEENKNVLNFTQMKACMDIDNDIHENSLRYIKKRIEELIK